MKYSNRILWGTLLIVSLFHVVACAEEQKSPIPAHLQNPMVNPLDNPDLPNILILGDSISIGYTPEVRRLLDGVADVFRPTTNCMYSSYGVLNVEEWVGNREWDVIHFNHGIWDVHFMHDGVMVMNLDEYAREEMTRRVTTEQYIQNLEKILSVLKQTDAVLIWATTTPLISEGADTELLMGKNDLAARKLMEQRGVIIDDLGALATPNLKEWQLDDGCHYNPLGCAELAKQVAGKLSVALKEAQSSTPACCGE